MKSNIMSTENHYYYWIESSGGGKYALRIISVFKKWIHFLYPRAPKQDEFPVGK
jgi:hypothetical protein